MKRLCISLVVVMLAMFSEVSVKADVAASSGYEGLLQAHRAARAAVPRDATKLSALSPLIIARYDEARRESDFEWDAWLELLAYCDVPEEQAAGIVRDLRAELISDRKVFLQLDADTVFYASHAIAHMESRKSGGAVGVDWIEHSPKVGEISDERLRGMAWLVLIAREDVPHKDRWQGVEAHAMLTKTVRERFFETPVRLGADERTLEKLLEFLGPPPQDQRVAWANQVIKASLQASPKKPELRLSGQVATQVLYRLRLNKELRKNVAVHWIQAKDVDWAHAPPRIATWCVRWIGEETEPHAEHIKRVLTQVLASDRIASGELSLGRTVALIKTASKHGVDDEKIIAALSRCLEANRDRVGSSDGLGGLVLYASSLGSGREVKAVQRLVYEYALKVGASDARWLVPHATTNLSAVIAPLYAHEIEQNAGDTPRLFALLNNTPGDLMLSLERVRRTPSPGQAKQAIYNPYWAHTHNGSTGFGRKAKEGLVLGRLEPKPATLALMAWHMKSTGELDEWKLYLDDRVRSTPKATDHVDWLIGRAYAQEITVHESAPLAGISWLGEAMAAAASEPQRLDVLHTIFLRYAAVGQLDQASSLLKSIENQFESEESIARIASLKRMAGRIEQGGQQAEATRQKQLQARRLAGRIANLQREVAQMKARGAQAGDIQRVERLLASLQAQD